MDLDTNVESQGVLSVVRRLPHKKTSESLRIRGCGVNVAHALFKADCSRREVTQVHNYIFSSIYENMFI